MIQKKKVAQRYAGALFELARQSQSADVVLEELRLLGEVFGKEDISDFFLSPVVSAKDKKTALQAILDKVKFSETMVNFLRVLADKQRLNYFSLIQDAYQSAIDEANGVTRGMVRSAVTLGPDERVEIEKIVSQVTKKKVILTYKRDPELIGGLVAEVGSYTFDDTIESHLRRMRDQLKRRAH